MSTMSTNNGHDLPLREFKERVLDLIKFEDSSKIENSDIVHFKQHDYFASDYLSQYYNFASHEKSIEHAAHQFVRTLRWRKEIGIHEMIKNTSRELFQLPFATWFDYGDRVVYYAFSKRVPLEYRLTEYFALWMTEMMTFEICRGRKVSRKRIAQSLNHTHCICR